VDEPASLRSVLARISESAPWVSDEEVARYERGRRIDERTERLRLSGVLDVLPTSVAEAVARERLDATRALDVVRRWAAYQRGTPRPRDPRPVLVLMGDMGRGKTVAAASLLASESGRYVSAEELCRLHAARWGDDREIYQRLMRSGVLVVDEVGTEENPRIAQAAIHEVVDKRQGERLTLLLGNMDPAALQARLDARTWDRLRQLGTMVEVEGESLRRGDL
jgi:hypothetical protein